jgi:hypothetical protein
MELTEEVQVAISATEAFVNVLTTEGLNGWAARFSSILAQLRAGDVQAATHSFRNCSYTGPGSLSDVFAKDEVAFNKAWGLCARSIRALPKA